jgi:hypothetical protein
MIDQLVERIIVTGHVAEHPIHIRHAGGVTITDRLVENIIEV